MASCKFEGGKCKGAQATKAAFRHNDISIEKRKIAKKKNKHIDLEKCKYNFSILGLSYEERCRKYDERIEYLDSHGNSNRRKDRVTMQCIEIPVPAGLPRERYHDWFLRVVDILRKKYGEKNFIDADIHYDEEHTYRDPETKELVVSRVHLHFMVVPEIDGKLNAKELSLRKNMRILNKEVDEMTKAEFGCSFMTGTKKKSYKKVEELKQESENAELLYQIEQKKKALDAQQTALNAHKAALDARDKELQNKEESILETQNTLAEWQNNLEQREAEVQDLEEQKKTLSINQIALDVCKSVLNNRNNEIQAKEENIIETQNALTEWQNSLEVRERTVQDLEDQKKSIIQEWKNIKQKEESLDKAIENVTKMPAMDSVLKQVLNSAFVTFHTYPGSPAIDVTAMWYLEHLQKEQKEQTEQIRKTVRRTVPDYTFNTQQPQDDGMGF